MNLTNSWLEEREFITAELPVAMETSIAGDGAKTTVENERQAEDDDAKSATGVRRGRGRRSNEFTINMVSKEPKTGAMTFDQVTRVVETSMKFGDSDTKQMSLILFKRMLSNELGGDDEEDEEDLVVAPTRRRNRPRIDEDDDEK